MKDNGMVRHAAHLAGRIAANGFIATPSEWMIYGSALHHGKTLHPVNCRDYSNWIIENGLDGIPSRLRSASLRLYREWEDAYPYIKNKGPLSGASNPEIILMNLKRLTMLSRHGINIGDLKPDSRNVGNIFAACNVIDDLVKAATICRNDKAETIILSVIDRISDEVIASAIA